MILAKVHSPKIIPQRPQRGQMAFCGLVLRTRPCLCTQTTEIDTAFSRARRIFRMQMSAPGRHQCKHPPPNLHATSSL